MADFLKLFRPWRGGSRQMIVEDYIAAFSLPLLVILIGRQEALLFDSPSSLIALLCLVYTGYLIHAKNRWPRSPSSSAVLVVLASVLAVSVTLIPGPRLNAWLTSLLLLQCLCLYRYLLELAWKEFRISFTPGELLMLSQMAVIITFSTSLEILKYTRVIEHHEAYFSASDTHVSVVGRVSVHQLPNFVNKFHPHKFEFDFRRFEQTAVVSAIFVFIASLSNPQNFYTYVIAAILFVVGHVTAVLGRNPVTWFVEFLLKPGRMALITYWLCFLAPCFPLLSFYRHEVTEDKSRNEVTSRPRGPNTVTRKFFHVIILAIFLPGLYLDVELLYLGSGVALTALVLLETIRLHKIPPLGHVISDLFSSFRDRQDRGRLILTPIYLLGACGAPVWLCGARIGRGEDPSLVLFLGVMSVGVGDAVAAIFGSKLGHCTIKLSGHKSLAGLVAGLVAQFAFWLAVYLHGMGGEHSTMPVIIVLSSVTETFTSHVDNLVVPVYTLLAYIILEYGVIVYRTTDVDPG